jgi:hypothetical protein
MKRFLISLVLLTGLAAGTFAQDPGESKIKIKTKDSDDNSNPTPYHTKFAVDGSICVAGMGLSALGLKLIQDNKHAPSAAELAAIDADLEAAKEDVPAFDRFAAGNFDLDAKHKSDYPFYGSFVAPMLLLLDKDIRGKSGQVFVLYLETMAITGTVFTMTVSHVERKRPLIYNNDPDNHERTKKHSQNSFFAGHTAASASACFFAAKIFNDFNPDCKWRPAVWGVAAAVPATVGYFRLKAGKHFLSDNIIGYVLGASTGILVPQLHKTKGMEHVSIVPVMGPYNGMAATITF